MDEEEVTKTNRSEQSDLDRVDRLLSVMNWVPKVELTRLESPSDLSVFGFSALDDGSGGILERDDDSSGSLSLDAE